MSVNSMSLPVDIPWERWCVSEDMIDKRVCDSDRPAKWQSSIAVFKYVPTDDYQIYPRRKITYIKVVCTISGYQAKADEVQGILKNIAGITVTDLTDAAEKVAATYFPCNEALVQVSVAPDPKAKLPLDKYPYFMDFQPKKRELIEAATDTNEIMSRSLESLNIGKSAGSTQSQEVLDIDQGFSVGASGQGAGYGGSFNYSQQGQWGTKQLGGNQSGLARTTDESHERRETVSHSAQTTQLRHLLDSYHIGTNRAVFFIQPRPNTLQEPSGFVGDSPRPIEGIQEFVLIVNQPKDTPDFCLDVRLDTGHLVEVHRMEYLYRTDTPTPLSFTNPTPIPNDTDLDDNGTTMSTIRSDTFSLPIIGTIFTYSASAQYNCKKRTRTSPDPPYTPDNVNDVEYVIDVDNMSQNPDNVGDGNPTHLKGYRILTPPTQASNATFTIDPATDGSSLTVQATAMSQACFKGGLDKVQISASINGGALAAAIALEAANPFGGPDPFLLSLAVTGVSAVATYEAAMTAGAFAGAPGAINQQQGTATVAYEVFLRSKEPVHDTGIIDKRFIVTTRGLCCCRGDGEKQGEGIVYESNHAMVPAGTTMTTATERALRSAMRQEILRSTVSVRRTAPRSLAQTQLGIDLLLPVLLQDPFARRALTQPSADAIPEDVAKKTSRVFRQASKQLSRLQLLRIDPASLAKATGLDEASAHRLKTAMLTTRVEVPPVPKAQKQLTIIDGPKTRKGKR